MRFIIVVLLFTLIISCGGQSNGRPPKFDGEEAYGYLVKQVSFGPRVPGTRSAESFHHYLMSFFDSLGVRVDTMPFVFKDMELKKNVPMRNFVAHIEGKDGPSGARYLLAAHYDSRPRAENDPDSTKRNRAIDGANDGASGVAVLMELGRLLVSNKPAVNVDLAFLDGEDWGKSGDLEDYFLGAKDMITRGIKDKYKFGILIDMVGDKDLKIYKEQFSVQYAPKVTDLIWKTARELGEKAFADSVGYTVYDDHLTFMTIGLPMTDVIDFVYPYWHSTNDTPDKCSAQSLATVGRVLSTIIYRLK